MTSIGDGTSTSSQTDVKTSRTFKSRISSLFGSKANSLSEPQIKLEEPWREYTRGDLVKGSVVLNVTKPLGITHLTVSLFGYLEVFKHHARNQPSLRPTPVRVASGKGKRWVSEYYGDGFASLFEYETTLCGQGRLDPNVYHFQFEMQFPSDRDLPSSIKFERGIVTYGLAVTMTRPTTMAPTLTVTEPIKYKQTIDVADLRPPKPRIVTLEPVTASTRARVVRRLTSTSNADGRSVSQLSSKSKVNSQSRSTAATPSTNDIETRSLASPVPSAPSNLSISSAGRQEPSSPSEPRASQSSQDAATNSQASKEKQVITATVEISKAGVLPGDLLPLYVYIQHTKSIQSPAGIIVTLYREARVDMHPNLPNASMQQGDKSRKPQDYYPMSRTGLGGLSLTAAGSSQVWRKDLSQAIAPLYVDDHTRVAVIRPVLAIPEDIFSTLSNAPGDMIVFKYVVEVMIDIHGKWAAAAATSDAGTSARQSTFLTGLDGRLDETKSTAVGGSTIYYPSAPKGAIKVQCEIVIGTRDSSRNKGKGKESANETNKIIAEPSTNEDISTLDTNAQQHDNRNYSGYLDGHDAQSYDSRYYDPRYYDYSNDNFYEGNDQNLYDQPPSWEYSQAYPPVPPPPNLTDDSHLSEKERLRRAEETLLPSQPPEVDGPRDAFADYTASAPFLPDDNYDATSDVPQHSEHGYTQAGQTENHAFPSTNFDGSIHHRFEHAQGAFSDVPVGPSAPPYNAFAQEEPTSAGVTETTGHKGVEESQQVNSTATVSPIGEAPDVTSPDASHSQSTAVAPENIDDQSVVGKDTPSEVEPPPIAHDGQEHTPEAKSIATPDTAETPAREAKPVLSRSHV